MPKPLRLLLVALVVVVVLYVVYSSLHTARFRVEVCVSYHDLSACRVAEGRTQEEAQRAAHDNACSQITSGVTGTLGCQNTPASSVRWLTQ
ncbi:MAG: hypothetical protein ACRD2D_02600 [Terriglobales bacterium]